MKVELSASVQEVVEQCRMANETPDQYVERAVRALAM